MIKTKSSRLGFTLVEIAIVILIVGVILVPLLQLYSGYITQKKYNQTTDNINTSVSGIGAFSPIRLPCPTDRSLPPGDPNYGMENCDLTTIPTCTTGLEGICQTNGARDADGDGTIDLIVIGGVPSRYKTPVPPLPGPYTERRVANLRAVDTVDGWGNQLTYAVSAKLMDPNLLKSDKNFKLGVIRAVDEFGNPTAGVNDDAQFVVVSHGPDGVGAFNQQGVLTPCQAGTVQTENCNNDFTFAQALGEYQANTAAFYDDKTYFFLERSGDLWDILQDSHNSPSPNIINLNTNNVGIKTTTPAAKLDVAGAINADTVRSDRYCDKAGTNCIDPTYFGTLHGCGSGEVMVGLSGGNPICRKPGLTLPPGYAGVTCPGPANWVEGILSNGCVICSDGSKVC